MGISFSTQENGHILIATIDDQYDMVNDIVPLSIGVIEHLNEGPDHVVVIIDGRAVQVKDLNSLLQSAQKMSLPEVKASREHCKVFKTYSVVNNRIVTAAMKGLNTATFGYVQSTMFDTVEAAVAQAQIDLEAIKAH